MTTDNKMAMKTFILEPMYMQPAMHVHYDSVLSVK